MKINIIIENCKQEPFNKVLIIKDQCTHEEICYFGDETMNGWPYDFTINQINWIEHMINTILSKI